MMSKSKDAVIFFLILTAVFGLYVRLFPIVRSGFPLVDGGMFFTMINDLQSSHFTLPEFTTYNQSGIPFAYPPLAFYISGWINSVSTISLIDIIKWQPVLTCILVIPFFYVLAILILKSKPNAALATLIFTLTPNSYWWNIVGGGLTRSLGTLFFTITTICAVQMYREKKAYWVIGTILGGTFVAISHLTWALQLVVVIVLLWLFEGRGRQGVLNTIFVAAGILLITSPWWTTIIRYHGMDTFIQAGQVTQSRFLFWTILFVLSFTGEYTPVIAVFALIGLFINLSKRNYFLPLWAALCLFVDPRGGMPASIFPFSVMAVSTITDAIAPRLFDAKPEIEKSDSWIGSLYSTGGRLFFGFFIILFLYNSYNVSNTLSHQVLGKEEFDTINWVTSNTSATDRFLILDEQENLLLSPFTEWFPALTNRRSIATIQGTEWLGGEGHYSKQYPVFENLHQCLYRDVECLYDFHDEMTENYDFIIIYSKNPVPLHASLVNNPDFVLAYASPTMKIFKTFTAKH